LSTHNTVSTTWVPPSAVVSRYFGGSEISEDASMLSARMPYDLTIGTSTPISLPVAIEIEPLFPLSFKGRRGACMVRRWPAHSTWCSPPPTRSPGRLARHSRLL
jgi:hypothetical protein